MQTLGCASNGQDITVSWCGVVPSVQQDTLPEPIHSMCDHHDACTHMKLHVAETGNDLAEARLTGHSWVMGSAPGT